MFTPREINPWQCEKVVGIKKLKTLKKFSPCANEVRCESWAAIHLHLPWKLQRSKTRRCFSARIKRSVSDLNKFTYAPKQEEFSVSSRKWRGLTNGCHKETTMLRYHTIPHCGSDYYLYLKVCGKDLCFDVWRGKYIKLFKRHILPRAQCNTVLRHLTKR